MKVLTEQETELLSDLEIMHDQFKALPYMKDISDREYLEVKKRIDELKQIVAIRAMLRDGDGKGLPEQQKQIS